MTKIILASNNKGKIKEVKEICKDMPVEIVREKYPSAYDCARKVADYLERKYGNQTSDSELLYLTLHINCLISKNKAKEETW